MAIPTRELDSGDNKSSLPALAFVSHAERLAKIEFEVIANLPQQDSTQVLQTRANAKLLSETAWRIECACDAQLISNAKNMRSRGSLGDTEGIGKMAAVRRQAKKVGCTPQTIFKNAQIFHLIKKAEGANPEMSTSLRILNERKYFVVALMAADPIAALNIFIEKKKSLSRFRTTDAERLLERLGLTKKSVSSVAINNARESLPALSTRASEIEHINLTIDLIKEQVISKCTNSEVIRIHESYIEELSAYMGEELFDQDAAMALRRAHRMGNHWEDQLAKATKFPLEVVHREMRLLGALGQFIEVPGQIGKVRWHKVGEPLPPELRRHP